MAMNKNRIFRAVFPEPFHPFVIKTTSGRSFEILYSDVVGYGVSFLRLYTPDVDIPEATGDWFKIPLTEIESIEPLESPVTPTKK